MNTNGRLTAARAVAWALLLAGWVGLGAVALALTPSLLQVYALVALWLLALGLAATIATHDRLGSGARRWALAGNALLTAGALHAAVHGRGLGALTLALLGWAGMTALASGVVRSLRLALPTRPQPPVLAAGLGAAAAALALGDPGDLQGLVWRLSAAVLVAAAMLATLQPTETPRSGCRAGLFDCSLPAWPAGAWQDALQWPALLAGLAMLPMMAALSAMVAWCRAEAVAPQAMVLLHLGSMFVPALLLRGAVLRWPPGRLALVCALLLAGGAAVVAWGGTPWDLLGVALLQGAAWSLAWTGQLWAPERRGSRSASPLRAAFGYAAFTLLAGLAIELRGPSGLAALQIALGLAALLAWAYGAATQARRAALP